jgi:hypothetical protein
MVTLLGPKLAAFVLFNLLSFKFETVRLKFKGYKNRAANSKEPGQTLCIY